MDEKQLRKVLASVSLVGLLAGTTLAPGGLTNPKVSFALNGCSGCSGSPPPSPDPDPTPTPTPTTPTTAPPPTVTAPSSQVPPGSDFTKDQLDTHMTSDALDGQKFHSVTGGGQSQQGVDINTILRTDGYQYGFYTGRLMTLSRDCDEHRANKSRYEEGARDNRNKAREARASAEKEKALGNEATAAGFNRIAESADMNADIDERNAQKESEQLDKCLEEEKKVLAQQESSRRYIEKRGREWEEKKKEQEQRRLDSLARIEAERLRKEQEKEQEKKTKAHEERIKELERLHAETQSWYEGLTDIDEDAVRAQQEEDEWDEWLEELEERERLEDSQDKETEKLQSTVTGVDKIIAGCFKGSKSGDKEQVAGGKKISKKIDPGVKWDLRTVFTRVFIDELAHNDPHREAALHAVRWLATETSGEQLYGVAGAVWSGTSTAIKPASLGGKVLFELIGGYLKAEGDLSKAVIDTTINVTVGEGASKIKGVFSGADTPGGLLDGASDDLETVVPIIADHAYGKIEGQAKGLATSAAQLQVEAGKAVGRVSGLLGSSDDPQITQVGKVSMRSNGGRYGFNATVSKTTLYDPASGQGAIVFIVQTQADGKETGNTNIVIIPIQGRDPEDPNKITHMGTPQMPGVHDTNRFLSQLK